MTLYVHDIYVLLLGYNFFLPQFMGKKITFHL